MPNSKAARKNAVTEQSVALKSDLAAASPLREATLPLRCRLPDTRRSVTHKFNVAGHEGYLTVGLFEDGRPGELFIKMAKAGSTMAGMTDTIGVLTSLALQYGVPVEVLASKFENVAFEPSGTTKNRDIHEARSIVDYIFRWLGLAFSESYRAEKHPTAAHAEDKKELN